MYIYVYIHITLNYTISLNFAATSPPFLNIRAITLTVRKEENIDVFIYLFIRACLYRLQCIFFMFANQTTSVRSCDDDDNDGDDALQ